MIHSLLTLAVLALACGVADGDEPVTWTPRSPRDEIRPAFRVQPGGGRDGGAGLVIEHDSRPGLDGWYERSFPVTGGGWYRFAAARRIEGVPVPRQSCLVRIRWEDESGKIVPLDERPPHADPRQPVPGPSTDHFGALARKHALHVVFSLLERDGHLIHNTAVLIGPDGGLVGRYRKVCLPPGEAAKGIAPGSDYPVFDTPFGRVGLMVCYDGFFPEVARELSSRGAEVIAWPVWGCNPLLARARAAENRVVIVSSTFMDESAGWMISAVFDRNGTPVAKGEQWGTVAVAEVELDPPYRGPYNLGDFRAMLPRHRPPPAAGSPGDAR